MSQRFWTLAVFAICVIITVTSAFKTERIAGGLETHVVSLPYQVSIRRKSCSQCEFEHFASGAIYSRNVILTTAASVRVEDIKSLIVVAGTSYRTAFDGLLFPVEKKIIHEKFDVWTLNYDIALLKLKTDIPLGNSLPIRAIGIASVLPEVGAVGVVGGWGLTSEMGDYSELIKSIQIPTVSRESCQEVHKFIVISENMFCAGLVEGGKDTCRGDAGAPFVVGKEIIGLVSWGVGCARPNSPGVYTNLVDLREWIDEQVECI